MRVKSVITMMIHYWDVSFYATIKLLCCEICFLKCKHKKGGEMGTAHSAVQ